MLVLICQVVVVVLIGNLTNFSCWTPMRARLWLSAMLGDTRGLMWVGLGWLVGCFMNVSYMEHLLFSYNIFSCRFVVGYFCCVFDCITKLRKRLIFKWKELKDITCVLILYIIHFSPISLFVHVFAVFFLWLLFLYVNNKPKSYFIVTP